MPSGVSGLGLVPGSLFPQCGREIGGGVPERQDDDARKGRVLDLRLILQLWFSVSSKLSRQPPPHCVAFALSPPLPHHLTASFRVQLDQRPSCFPLTPSWPAVVGDWAPG